ncbi:prepilin-type N-terminal cleavage/methylation domain-containing protein [candidate division WOR-3 bacterium]|nr:prepilin-type N-terminal cleavage/methylation domain-containing protein [candidate division WOR-3 bacterium]
MNKKGFTLVELVCVILVLGLVLTMVYQNFFFQEKSLRRQREWSEMNIKGRKASTYIAKQLRIIGYSRKIFGSSHSFGIINGTSNGIVYSHDVDGAQWGVVDAVDIHSMTVSHDTLYIDGNFAIDRVASLQFTYTDTTGAILPSIIEVDSAGEWQLLGGAPIESIKYNLRVYNPSVTNPDTINYYGLVSLRNKRP